MLWALLSCCLKVLSVSRLSTFRQTHSSQDGSLTICPVLQWNVRNLRNNLQDRRRQVSGYQPELLALQEIHNLPEKRRISGYV